MLSWTSCFPIPAGKCSCGPLATTTQKPTLVVGDGLRRVVIQPSPISPGTHLSHRRAVRQGASLTLGIGTHQRGPALPALTIILSLTMIARPQAARTSRIRLSSTSARTRTLNKTVLLNHHGGFSSLSDQSVSGCQWSSRSRPRRRAARRGISGLTCACPRTSSSSRSVWCRSTRVPPVVGSGGGTRPWTRRGQVIIGNLPRETTTRLRLDDGAAHPAPRIAGDVDM